MRKFINIFLICFVLVFFTAFPCVKLFAEDQTGGAAPVKSMQEKKSEAQLYEMQKRLDAMEAEMRKVKEESEIRDSLKMSDEEKSKEGEEILDAAGGDYTLRRPGRLGLEYSFAYKVNTYDALAAAGVIEHTSTHEMTHSANIEYPLRPYLTVAMDVPFIYEFDNADKTSTTDDAKKDVSDLGDVAFSMQLQPFKASDDSISPIISASLVTPTGRSPYKIDPNRELSTGSGTYAGNVGLNISKAMDPLVAFGGVSYTHTIPSTGLNFKPGGTDGEQFRHIYKVEPGDSFGLNMGLGYSLSYKVSLSLSMQYSYKLDTNYHWKTGDGDQVVTSVQTAEASPFATMLIGTSWRLTQKRSMQLTFGVGLLNNDPDLVFKVRLPFEIEL
ncbi:hypothetical protein [Desulforegula conservatrix]|uniref:hypothetical protein n=1 Tax=Desulforegula conservatrix TaxID=153026 RepID=UPI0004197AA4|nr:hypothetical protein [Desulforegula conservatrix]